MQSPPRHCIPQVTASNRKEEPYGRPVHVQRPPRASWCVDSGITYDELAERIGVPVGTLKAWIYGQRGISFPQACAIAEVFGKSLDDLREQKAAS